MEQPRAADIKHKRKIGKLKDSIFAHLAALNPSKSLAPHVMSHIEQKLPQLIPTSHTPTHPLYSCMIERAIRDLNEEGGSSEVAISEFLSREYEDLPWGHESFLTHHLEKLCKSKDIVRTNDGCYMFPVQSRDSRDIDKRGRKRLHMQNGVIEDDLVSQKMSCERNQVQGRQTALTERVNAAERRQLIEATERQIEVQLEGGKRQFITKLPEEHFPQELEDEVIRDQSQLHEQQVGVSSKMVVSCNDERSGGSADMSVQCGEPPLSMVIVRRKKKQLRKKSASKPWEVSICCGLMAKQELQEYENGAIKDQSQPQGQQIGYRSKKAGSCNAGGSNGSADMSIQCGESSLPIVVVEKKDKRLQQETPCEPWKVSICCGLMARAARQELYPKVSSQLRQSKSHLGKKAAALELQMCSDQQVELFSSDKLETNVKENIGVSSRSVPEHYGQWPPKRQGQGRLPMHPYQGMLPTHPGQLWPPQHQGWGKSPVLKHYARRTRKGICNEQCQQRGCQNSGSSRSNLAADASMEYSGRIRIVVSGHAEAKRGLPKENQMSEEQAGTTVLWPIGYSEMKSRSRCYYLEPVDFMDQPSETKIFKVDSLQNSINGVKDSYSSYRNPSKSAGKSIILNLSQAN